MSTIVSLASQILKDNNHSLCKPFNLHGESDTLSVIVCEKCEEFWTVGKDGIPKGNFEDTCLKLSADIGR